MTQAATPAIVEMDVIEHPLLIGRMVVTENRDGVLSLRPLRKPCSGTDADCDPEYHCLEMHATKVGEMKNPATGERLTHFQYTTWRYMGYIPAARTLADIAPVNA
jgi:hypothetical protein